MKLQGGGLRTTIANYLARFLIWGFCAGALFGAGIGFLLSIHLIPDPIRFVLSLLGIGSFSSLIGAVLGFFMGYGSGIATGLAAWAFFPDPKPLLAYRTIMIVLAYVGAYLTCTMIFHLLFNLSLGSLDPFIAIASLGAGIAAFFITGFLVRD